MVLFLFYAKANDCGVGFGVVGQKVKMSWHFVLVDILSTRDVWCSHDFCLNKMGSTWHWVALASLNVMVAMVAMAMVAVVHLGVLMLSSSI